MDLRQLRLFITVADHLNFHRAAEQLQMAQPPLSQAIKRLETELGFDLFIRQRKTIKLSPAGATFVAEARRTIAQFEHAVARARQTSLGAAGHLRLMFVPSANYSHLIDVIREFRRLHPEVELELLESASKEIVTQLEAGKIDVGFLRPEFSMSDKLNGVVVEKDRFIAALPLEHPCSGRGSIALKELAGDDFIIFSAVSTPHRSPTLYEQTVRLCRDAGFTPRIVQQAGQVHTIVNLVSAGLGVALVPSAISRVKMANVAFVALDESSPHLELPLMAATPATDASPAAQAFVSLYQRMVGNDPAPPVKGQGKPGKRKAPRQPGQA